MGMFDTVRSSYDLGPGFYRKDLQTKDLDCCMNEYWIDPSGRLFEVDYSGTHDFVDIPEEERVRPWNVFKTVPNGNRGKVKPVYLFKVIEVYPSIWDCKYAAYPRQFIYFRDGIITETRASNT
jgi:hypothetical protein